MRQMIYKSTCFASIINRLSLLGHLKLSDITVNDLHHYRRTRFSTKKIEGTSYGRSLRPRTISTGTHIFFLSALSILKPGRLNSLLHKNRPAVQKIRKMFVRPFEHLQNHSVFSFFRHTYDDQPAALKEIKR